MIMDMEQRNPKPSDPPGLQPGSPAPSEENAAGAAKTAGGGAAAGLPESGPDSCLRQLLRNLVRGMRLSLFLRVDPETFSATPGALALLALCDFFSNLVVSFFLVGRGDGQKPRRQ